MGHPISIRGIAASARDLVFEKDHRRRRPPRDSGFDDSMLLPANRKSFINKDSEQPAAKRALRFDAWRIPRGLPPAAFDSGVGSFRTAEHATRDQVQQAAAAAESDVKYFRVLMPPVCD
jgi:hypothetical protein